MPKLNYNLDEIKTFTIEPGKYRARLMKVENTLSKKKKPMLVWTWKIVSGSEKGKEIKSWTSLVDNALQNLKEHLEAFGLSGKVKTETKSLVGRTVILVLKTTPSEDDPDKEFTNVYKVKKDPSAVNVPEPVEDEDDDEDDDEGVDPGEDEDDEDEAPAPKKKKSAIKANTPLKKKRVVVEEDEDDDDDDDDEDDDDIPF